MEKRGEGLSVRYRRIARTKPGGEGAGGDAAVRVIAEDLAGVGGDSAIVCKVRARAR